MHKTVLLSNLFIYNRKATLPSTFFTRKYNTLCRALSETRLEKIHILRLPRRYVVCVALVWWLWICFFCFDEFQSSCSMLCVVALLSVSSGSPRRRCLYCTQKHVSVNFYWLPLCQSLLAREWLTSSSLHATLLLFLFCCLFCYGMTVLWKSNVVKLLS